MLAPRTLCALVLVCLLTLAAGAAERRKTKPSDGPAFGIKDPIPGSLRGIVFLLDKQTGWLPDYTTRKPVGVYYTNALNYSLRNFEQEWMGIEYSGTFYIRTPGKYRFYLESDDGAQLYINGRRVINNDGIHAAEEMEAEIELTAGPHAIRVPYFQGPGPYVALLLSVKPPKGKKQIFNMQDYGLPASVDPEEKRPTLQRK